MYQLEKYTTLRDSRHTCPSCGRKHCFSRYVNEQGEQLLAEGETESTAGKCEHKNKCGYHLRPREWFALHPDFKQAESWQKPAPIQKRKLCTISRTEVARYRTGTSTLESYLRSFFPIEDVERIFRDYQVGAFDHKEAIFWQIDKEGRPRAAKIMAYGEDGHRIKGDVDRIDWLHSRMKRDGLLPEGWELTQCFFGEHLLARYSNKPVCIVESEKTALVAALTIPSAEWLATGGINGLKAEKMASLKGRRIFVYPDADALEEWGELVEGFKQWYDIRIPAESGLLAYTAEDIENKRDIADKILKNGF